MTAFAHPGLFWAGLGLVSVPVLIHLFFRRRHRVVRWAAMEFLLAALKKQRRRIELENLILLLVRCAAILLLGTAVARPSVEAPALGAFGGGARAVVLVLDTSTSMGALHTGRSSLDRVKERAAKFLSELPDGSQVTLVASRDDQAGGTARALLENAEPGEVRTALPGVRLGYGPNRIGPLFRLVAEKLDDLRGRRLVVFLTDFQRRDWYGGEADARLEDAYLALKNLDSPEAEEPTPVVLYDAGQEDPANVVVSDISVDAGRQAFAGKLLGVTVSLLNYGAAPAAGTVTLYLARPDDEQWEKVFAEEVTVPAALGLGRPEALKREFLPRVPARSEGTARFRAVFTPHADAAGGDRLPVDSERSLALRVRPPVRILPIRTFRYALELLQDVELLEVIDLLPAIYPADLATYDLSDVDILLWADAEVHNLTPEDATKIEDFVRRGGGLLAYFGDYGEGAPVNRLFVDGKTEPLLPMRLGAMRTDEEHPVAVELADERLQAHPLFEDTERYFFSPEVTGYRRVSDYAEGAVVARYTNGDPAVLERTYGRGRVVVVTTSPDERDFRLNGSLLPAIFFFNAAHYLVWESPRLRNVTVGEVVDVPLPGGTRQVAVTPPAAAGGLTEEPVPEGATEFQLADTSVPGFYRIVARGLAGSAALPEETVLDIAVNIDASEGDLRRVSPMQLKRDYQGTALHIVGEEDEILPRGTTGDTGELSRSLLAGVVVLLFLELLFAGRFGTRRRNTA